MCIRDRLVTFASYVATGIVRADMLPLFALMVPAVLLPSILGTRLYTGLSETAFRKVLLGLLTLSGLALLISAIPQLVHRLAVS